MKNREIKFRAWDKEENNWIEDFDIGSDGTVMWTDLQGDKQDIYENAVLMQYTGLNDKNGKEIYEGDIVKLFVGDDHVSERVVDNIWDPYTFMWQDYDEFEITGNIYENPELLT